MTEPRERKASELARKLVIRLKAAGVPLIKPDDAYRIRRTRAGRHQRSSGAWSWCLERNSLTDYHMELSIGSQWPVKELLRGKFHVSIMDWGDYIIDPEPKQLEDSCGKRKQTGAMVGIPGER